MKREEREGRRGREEIIGEGEIRGEGEMKEQEKRRERERQERRRRGKRGGDERRSTAYSILMISAATADIRLTGLALKTTPNIRCVIHSGWCCRY